MGGKARAVSVMANLLLDFGSDARTSFFVGGGVGVARTQYTIGEISFGATDNNVAYQFIAGARTALSPSIDLGLKDRYFRSKYNLQEGENEEVLGRWKSHSLLASLIFNFGAPAPAPVAAPVEIAPPPPPPPPPAVQTCFDGSVILTTDVCPAPPVEVAPPPPVPEPERG